MPEEMIYLRNALDARKVPWQGLSDNLDRSFPFLNLITYRTVYKWKEQEYCVKSGYGTLGGDKGLLELSIDKDLPIGSLTAEKILRMMDETYEQ